MTKFIFFVIIFFAAFNSFSQENEIILKKKPYTVSYNEVYEQPNWVVYVVKKSEKNFNRNGLNFHKEKGIHTSDNKDYYKNIWDKGHLAPAADFTNTKEELFETFSFLNCTLQHEKLNRGQWKIIESVVRKWADSLGFIRVLDETIYNENHLILNSGGHVPNGFIKHLNFPDGSYQCYYFKNEDVKDWKSQLIDCKSKHSEMKF